MFFFNLILYTEIPRIFLLYSIIQHLSIHCILAIVKKLSTSYAHLSKESCDTNYLVTLTNVQWSFSAVTRQFTSHQLWESTFFLLIQMKDVCKMSNMLLFLENNCFTKLFKSRDLAVQWWGPHISTAGAVHSGPGWWIPHATRYSQK